MTNTEISAQIYALELTLTGDMMKDMETKDEIHKLRMQLNDVAPTCNLGEECENCGS